MLNLIRAHGKAVAAADDRASRDADVLWFDLADPDDDERRRVERITGLKLPTRESMRAIELSNRIRFDADALYLNIPFFAHARDAAPSPVGMIVSEQCLVSIRFADSDAFAQAAEAIATGKDADGATVFVELVTAIVGQIADQLEDVAAKTGQLSSRVLRGENQRTRHLRAALGEVGQLETRLTRARLTATGLQRIVGHVGENLPAWFGNNAGAHLHTAKKDIDALCELDGQLTNKLQFLLDAVLGFINIDQNEVIKVLTVASVVSIPPIVLAGIWGMNFTHMPELKWFYGYPLALAAIALSVIVPLLWFKRRGWL